MKHTPVHNENNTTSHVTKTSGIPWTPANIVTCIRIVLIPVLVVVMLVPWGTAAVKPWVTMVLFAGISLTDSLDGYLARSRGEVTTFGKFMDPIADKLLVVAAMIALVETSGLPSWIPIIIIARELLVSGLRMLAASSGVVIAASYYGKAKTLFTMLAIAVFMVKDASQFTSIATQINAVAWVLMIVALVLTIVSMIDYFAKSRHLLMDGEVVDKEAQGNPEQPSSAELTRDIHELAQKVISQASRRGYTIGTAESLTGGLICASLTSIPGSSEVVAGGVASYMARIKEAILGVTPATIADKGVVSQQTAAEMANGALAKLDTDLAVAVTGVAGPSGGTSQTPVGTVCFGLAQHSALVYTETQHYTGDRDLVRLQTTRHALELLLSHIEGVQQ